MSRLKSLVSALVMLSVLIASVSAFAAPPKPKTDVSKQAAKVAAFNEIVKMVKSEKPDYDAVTKLYNEKLKETVTARDKEFNEQLDQTLTATFNAVKANQMTLPVAAQITDKLLQKVFILTIKHEFVAAKDKLTKKDNPGALHHIDEAIAYFEAVRGTVKKRDAAFGTTLETEIDTALTAAQTAAEKGDEKMIYFLQPAVTHNLALAVWLAAGGYADTVQKGAAEGKNVKGAQAEGWAFFQTIKGNVGKKTPELATFVESQFDPIKGDPKALKADEVKAAMTAGLFGYVQNYTAGYEKEWDKLARFHWTAEGAIIAKGLVKKVGEALGADAQGKYEKAIASWTDAVLKDDKARAATGAKEVQDLSAQAQAKFQAQVKSVAGAKPAEQKPAQPAPAQPAPQQPAPASNNVLWYVLGGAVILGAAFFVLRGKK